jgi:5'-nucleotidase
MVAPGKRASRPNNTENILDTLNLRSTQPWLLATNDDGVDAHGLHELERALRPLGQLCTVAPAQERSGASHSISVRRGLRCEQAPYMDESGDNLQRWAVDGTPADCVIAALSHVLVFPPAVVVSGINHGGNMGRNIHYSGTVGAASEAALHGIPAIAMSLCGKPPADFTPAANLAAQLAAAVLHQRLPEGSILNVNVPVNWRSGGEVRATRAYRRQSRTMMSLLDDREGLWVRESVDWESAPADSDLRAIDEMAASVSLIEVYPAVDGDSAPFDLKAFLAGR